MTTPHEEDHTSSTEKKIHCHRAAPPTAHIPALSPNQSETRCVRTTRATRPAVPAGVFPALPRPIRLGLVSRLQPWLRGILVRLSAGAVETGAAVRGIRP
ncbi:hypothetical protein EYF80_039727 [Liparis tanakae]|uniref:Uncharacterized protein n=1 Tax=Liparis tanakae TaxID=230148 RepID=A0A4Z2G954_9TELE|nr:hypothetical protein EYF80_039727 [Liparis tanakae]